MAHNIPKIEYGNGPTTIEFDFPPEVDDGEHLEAKSTVTLSVSGARQVSTQFVEVLREFKWGFLSEALRTQLQTFYENHALAGGIFKFFEDKNDTAFRYYELDALEFKPTKRAIVTENTYRWDLPMRVRRVLGLTQGEDTMFSILNNQLVAVNVAGLIFDKTQYSCAIVTAELRRVTATQSVESVVTLIAIYNTFTDDWELSQSFVGDDCGVDFSITSAGQLQYTSDDLTGSGYSGTLKAKQSLFSA